ncbi:acetyltransferase [Chryseobacterium sp. A321]
MYLIGASGHGKVIADIAELNDFKIKAFIDEDKTKNSFVDYPVLHTFPQNKVIATICIGNNVIRKRIYEANTHMSFRTLIHPNSTVSNRAKIEEGTVVMAGVTVNSECMIGKHCILNTNASIDHDCAIEDFAHISPNVGLAGNVTIGEGTHVGIGANVIQGVKIGKWCTIGAGAVILGDVPDYSTVVGNPGRIIKSILKPFH